MMAQDGDHVARGARRSSALLLVDMINTWEMQDGAALLRQSIRILPNLVRLASSARRARAPVIYANDNFGRWQSNLPATIEQARQAGAASARIVDALAPRASDYVVLKPAHSAFFATPLELLLQKLEVQRLVVAGVAGDQCVLATVGDALLRDYTAIVPRDAIATPTTARTRAVLKHFREVMDVATPASRGLRWS